MFENIFKKQPKELKKEQPRMINDESITESESSLILKNQEIENPEKELDDKIKKIELEINEIKQKYYASFTLESNNKESEKKFYGLQFINKNIELGNLYELKNVKLPLRTFDFNDAILIAEQINNPEKIKQIEEITIKKLEEHSSKLIESKEFFSAAEDLLGLSRRLIISGDIKRGFSFYEKTIDLLIKIGNTSTLFSALHYLDEAKYHAEKINDNQKILKFETQKKELIKSMPEIVLLKKVELIFDKYGKDSSEAEITRKILANKEIVKKWSIDYQEAVKTGDIISEWKSSSGFEKRWSIFSDHIHKNIDAIIELEKRIPGAYLNLYKDFGISHFARYKTETLVSLYNKKEGKDNKMENIGKPLAVVLAARADWNGAFYNTADDVASLEKDFNTIIVEVETRNEAARKIISAFKDYGEISVFFINGHGEPNGTWLSYKENGFLGVDQLLKGDFSKYFIKKPAVVFCSCSTGVDNGIVEQISQKYKNVTFYAPTYSIDVNLGIEFKGFSDSTPQFNIRTLEVFK